MLEPKCRVPRRKRLFSLLDLHFQIGLALSGIVQSFLMKSFTGRPTIQL